VCRRGLGLALVRQIAHRHGGEVRLAEPRPGEGACSDVVLRDMFEVGAARDQDLADAGKVELVPCYGAPGRPEHHYRWVG
jgi:hypothetical protein